MLRTALTGRLFVGSAFIVLAAAATSDVAAQALQASELQRRAAPPPDFSTYGTSWVGGIGVDFVPTLGSPPLMRQDPKYPYVPNGTSEQPTYRIGDLSNPNLKQWAKDVMKKDNDEVIKGKIAFTPRSSCMPAGVPGFMLYGGGSVFFVQTPKKVTMIFDGDQQVRHIYMDVPHSDNLKPSWYGESIGRYEGDTLVIDTIGQNAKSQVDVYRTPHTEKLHVVERWRMIDNGNGLEVLVTVDDPDTYYQPWQAIRRYRKAEETLGEEVCAENNLHLFDYGVPRADKPDF